MKPEEALNTVNKVIEHGSMCIDDKDGSIHCYSFWYAVRSALEKQIPKKAVDTFTCTDFESTHAVIYGHCPTCSEFVSDNAYNFCPKCGQALDWLD